MAALQTGSAFTLRQIRQVSPSTAVASIEIGPVTIGSVWVNGCDGDPVVNWPRSTRGYPIATITDDRLRLDIEEELLAVVTRWCAMREGREVA